MIPMGGEFAKNGYQGQVDELVALSQLWQCFGYMKQPEKAQSMLPRIKDAVEKMSAAAWDAPPSSAMKWAASFRKATSSPFWKR